MKTKTLFCALALLATITAVEASAEARNYSPNRTTVQQLANAAEIIVVGKVKSVENVQLTEVGLDAEKHKRLDDGTWQDGEKFIRRDAVMSVNSVIKGNHIAGEDMRFVSIRQLKIDAYDADLRNEEGIYFLSKRADGFYALIQDERGTLTASEASGDINKAIAFVKNQVANEGASELFVTEMLDAITLDGSRISVDCAIELSWRHEYFAPVMTAEQRTRILDLCRLSAPGSLERNELLTAAGRHPAEGALEGMLEIMFADTSWSTSSLGAMSLEYINRGAAIARLLQEYSLATDTGVKTVIVRSLGLIRPKAGHDGPVLRTHTLDLVKGLLNAETDKNLLREALIASRDLRSEDAHVEELKALIDNRETNGLGDAEVKAAIVALAAARVVDPEGATRNIDENHMEVVATILAKDYLVALGKTDEVLKQTIDSSLKFPYTTLIAGADGKGH